MAGISHTQVARILAEIASMHIQYQKDYPSFANATALLTNQVALKITDMLDDLPENVGIKYDAILTEKNIIEV